MKVLLWLGTAIPVAVAMEFWAQLLHGKIWHGLLWFLHRSHHRPRKGRFEANDVLSVLHAPPAIAMILYGCVGPVGVARELVFGVGLGMTLFGVAYFVVHDGLVHGRLPVAGLLRYPYFVRVVEHHQVHHEGGHRAPYGFFWLGEREERRVRRGVHQPTPSATREAQRAAS